MKNQLTEEQSVFQAEIIKMIAVPISILDIEYCKNAATRMKDQASRQESMMVINPSHPQIKNDILRKKGQALDLLCQYADALKEIQELEKQLEKQEQTREKISNMFT